MEPSRTPLVGAAETPTQAPVPGAWPSLVRALRVLPCVVAILTVSVAPVLHAQGVQLGAGFGVTKPDSIPAAPSGALWVRVGVHGPVALQIDLSGWTVRLPDTVLVVVGTDPFGNPIFAAQELDYPVSDLSLGLTPTLRVPLGHGWHLLAGVGARLHYLTSDLRRLEIDGDSELRIGFHAMAGVELAVSSRLDIFLWPRLDLVTKVDHFGVLGGVAFTP